MEAAVVSIPAAATEKKDNLLHSEVKLFNRWSFDGVQVLICELVSMFDLIHCVDLCSFSKH